MNSKLVLTLSAALYGIFGTAWFTMPAAMGKYWMIAQGDNLNYMGHRYGAFMLGLVAALWLARNAPAHARRAVLMGALVATALTTALSLYGALALGLNAWPATITEFVMGVGFVWALFINPEPMVEA